ncbi:MAG: hypothetical protein J5778_01625, partial [Clostridiales bacterium]|nr:hypothetical protein [Clostridiales bacterium]
MKIIRDLKFSKLIASFIAVMVSVLTISSLSAFLNADTLTMDIVFDKPITLEFGDGQEYGFVYKATKDGVVDVVSDGDDTIQFLFAVPREPDTQYSDVLHIDYNSMSAEVEAGKTYRIFARCKYLIKNNTRVTFKFIPGGTKVVEINETNFPDANFRKLVSNNFDLSKDGWLTDLEIERVTKIEFLAENITDAKGIEYFTSVKRIDLYANDIASIDLSANTELEYLNLDKNNQITSLDLSRNKKLKELSLFECGLTSLDVSNCPDLRSLQLYDNDVEKLDFHNNRMLTVLDVCNNRKLTELDLSQNVNLTSLSCFNSNISSLNISKCKKLESINCDDNSLTSLDVSGFSNLKSLNCGWNKISSLNISGCTKLIDLLCANQKGNLKKLDISDCPGLQTAYRLGTEESEGTYVYKNGDVRYDLT